MALLLTGLVLYPVNVGSMIDIMNTGGEAMIGLMIMDPLTMSYLAASGNSVNPCAIQSVFSALSSQTTINQGYQRLVRVVSRALGRIFH